MKNDQKRASKMTNHNSTEPSSVYMRLTVLTTLGTKFTVLLNVLPLHFQQVAPKRLYLLITIVYVTLHKTIISGLFSFRVRDNHAYGWKPSLKAPLSLMLLFTFGQVTYRSTFRQNAIVHSSFRHWLYSLISAPNKYKC
jgi:hypothetical protein